MSLYDALLVDQNATSEEIKLAFKRRALQVHPDKGGSKEEFHLVYQALETLGDPAARQKYDHSLATASKKTEAAPHPKSKKHKREGKHAHPANSCKAETKTKPQTPGKKSTTSAGKAPSSSKSPRATAMPEEPQSKQTKLLMKIRDLLKRLPREVRNDVITNQFSQKQRVVLEKFMVDNAGTSSTQGHSEVKALAPAARNSAPNQAEFETETSPRETPRRTEDPSHGSCLVALPATNSAEANPGRRFAHSMDKIWHPKKRARTAHAATCNEPGHSATSSTMQASAAQSLTSETSETCATTCATTSSKKASMDETPGEGCHALAVPTSKRGCRPDVRMTRAKRAGKVNAKDKIEFNAKAPGCGCVQRTSSHSSPYVASICFDSFQMRTGSGCDFKTALDDLMILTSVKQKMRNRTGAGTFVERLQAAVVSSAAEHGRNLADLKLIFMVFQFAGCFIGSNLRSPSVRSLELLGKMRSVLEPFRQYCNHIGCQSVYWRYSPVHLEDAWGRFQLAVAEAWEIAGVDSTAILQKIRSRYETRAPFRIANLQRWEQQHMARQDKNRHRPKRLRERNPAGRLERWERQQMTFEDKNEHQPKKQRQNLHPCESSLSRQLTALRKLIARWGHMLKREAKLVDKERQRVLRQRKAQHKKDQEERRRVEVLKQKRQQEEERLRREWIRKRMRTDLTMDDILGQNSVRNYPKSRVHIILYMPVHKVKVKIVQFEVPNEKDILHMGLLHFPPFSNPTLLSNINDINAFSTGCLWNVDFSRFGNFRTSV